MDAFADLLRDLRSDATIIGQEILAPPFALRLLDGAPLTLAVPLRGDGWVAADGGHAPRRVNTGDIVIARGPAPFVFADDPATLARPNRWREVRCVGDDGAVDAVEVHPRDGSAGGGHAREMDSPDVDAYRQLAPRTCGTTEDGPTAILVGEYWMRGAVSRRLLDAVPDLLTVPCGPGDEALLSFVSAEVAAERPGQQVVLERLLDWLLVCSLRSWFDRPDAATPTWYRALGDPVVGPALRAMHDDPAHGWTVAQLAQRVGVARATLAKRFTDLVGEPPLGYLTGWRMTLAADLLAEPGATVATVARKVGYADGFGFSAAFKRTVGVSPSAYRAKRRHDGGSGPIPGGSSPRPGSPPGPHTVAAPIGSAHGAVAVRSR